MEKASAKKNDTKTIVSWEAEEYLQREKRAGWYVGFVIVALALVALSIILKWWTFTALVVLCAIALIIYSVRPPRKLHYSLNGKGLLEGDKLYEYDSFKNFGVLQDEDNYAIVLTPRKRFSPRVTVYFPKESGEKIVDAFGMRLPMEEVKLDFLDSIVRMLRI